MSSEDQQLEKLIICLQQATRNLEIISQPADKTSAATNEQHQESLNAIFPFKLITQHHPSRSNRESFTPDEEIDAFFFNVWIIDCFDSNFISTLFQFIKSKIYNDSNQSHKQSIKHLKSIKLLQNLNKQDAPTGQKGSSQCAVLLAREISISYQELTGKLEEDEKLNSLIKHSTPYRIKVPSKRAICRYYFQNHPDNDAEDDEEKDSNNKLKRVLDPIIRSWPIVKLEPTHLDLMSSTMKANQKMLQRQWNTQEIQWTLDQLQSIAKIALKSRIKEGELGVATSVSCYSLDPTEENAQIQSKKTNRGEEKLDNPTLMTATDRRISSKNPLRHSVVELTSQVSEIDRQEGGRIRRSPLDPIPYLLTNQVVFSTHEPCVMCSMALLHSRVKHLFFLIPAPASGGCGSVYNVHEQDGLNHKFFVWQFFPSDLLTSSLSPTLSFDP